MIVGPYEIYPPEKKKKGFKVTNKNFWRRISVIQHREKEGVGVYSVPEGELQNNQLSPDSEYRSHYWYTTD